MTPVAPDAPAAGPAEAEGRPMRLGLIGDAEALTDVVNAIPGLKVGAIADADDGWQAVINPNVVDGVILDVAPARRAAMVQDAIAVGVPVLCRGALATDATEMASLKRLAQLSGGLVMAWHPFLFESGWGALRELGEMIGPVRAVRATRCFTETMDPRTLLWRGAEDAVAACLELLGKAPSHCAAEVEGDGLLLRLAFPDDVAVQVALRQGAAAAERSMAVYRHAVLMRWSESEGLRLHPPVAEFAAPSAESEGVDLPEVDGPRMAIQTFAHMILEAEPQPQMLDFAGDVVAALAACAETLAG